MSVNRVILVGRVDPESRAFPNGGSICNLRIATSESWRDKQTGERQERTEWHRVVLRNKLGEIAQQYLTKGSQIYIEGRIQTRKWQNQQGQDQYTTEIIAEMMRMLDSRNTTKDQNSPQSQAEKQFASPPQQAAQSGQDYGGDYYDDDIPFNRFPSAYVI